MYNFKTGQMKIYLIIFALSLCAQNIVLADPIKLGADKLFETPYFEWIHGKRVGLITNHTSINSKSKSTADLLKNHPEIELVALFAPEHGLKGKTPAGEKFSGFDNIHSLYGTNLSPTKESTQSINPNPAPYR